MDPRCSKPRDFVAAARDMTEYIRKIRAGQMAWLQKYGGLLDEYERLEKEMADLCVEKHAVLAEREEPDSRSCLPTSVTSNGEYGWLASKPEFQLEKYGRYTQIRFDPQKIEPLLQGNIPFLATGKGLMR